MTRIIASIVALSVAAAAAAPMAAEARSKKKRAYPKPYAGQSYRAPRSTDIYVEQNADKLPMGTSEWWRQMDREGRGGQSRAN